MGKNISRSEAREIAIRAVFAEDNCAEVLELALGEQKASEPERKFIDKILSAVNQYKTEIDEKISSRLKDFTFDRLKKTDLAVLRAAFAELMLNETPRLAVIKEAVAAAKKYGTADSGKFVNGVLANE
jgi:N utilization substance protein B